jgi:L-alanine-DL-glutamate epimerase-like enolase superfamily enzyme
MDAMQLELSNFQPLAANEAVEQELQDLVGAEQVSAPMSEKSEQDLASLIRSVGMTSITDIDNLVSELQEARNYLHSEGERIRAEIARYTALTEAASASVKIIFDAVRVWRKADHSAHNQSHASAFEITDAVIEDASGWRDASDGPPRWYG